jgi:anti-sigma factor RsiW
LTTVVRDVPLRAANQDGPCDVRYDGTVFDLAAIRRAQAVDEGDLHAYVDALLETGRRAAIEAQLAQNPESRLAALAYRVINVDLHRLFDCALPPLSAPLERLSRELGRRIDRRAAG